MFLMIASAILLVAQTSGSRDICDVDVTERAPCGDIVNATEETCLSRHCCWNETDQICFRALGSKFTICKGEKYKIQCSHGYHIQIDSFFYGRRDNITCPDNSSFDTHLTHTNCSTPPGALQVLQEQCNGRQACWFKAIYQIWGYNPDEPYCNAVNREATVEYTCKECKNQYPLRLCMKKKFRGECRSEYQNTMDKCYQTCTQCPQKVCGNTYSGPDGEDMCDEWAMWKDYSQCVINKSFMLTYCKESCMACPQIVTAISSEEEVTTLPPTPTPEYELTICETWNIALYCDGPNEYIQINSFFYGRRDNVTCPDYAGHTHDVITNCTTPKGSFEKLGYFCNGRKSCWLVAGYDQWGIREDQPYCWVIYKEATVTYTCKVCANKYSNINCERMKSEGKCVTDYSHMMDNCYKSCTQCGHKDCGNIYEGFYGPQACDGWALRGDCVSRAKFMSDQCQESCLACENNSTHGPVMSLTHGSYGRVEVVYNGVKGTVCQDAWSDENCKVVCKQLNFTGGVTSSAYTIGGTGPIWLDHVVCDGTETVLQDCVHNGWGQHNCDHNEDAGCECHPPVDTSQPYPVRLSQTSEGRVEVIHDGQWGTICDRNFEHSYCEVICRQLEYSGGSYHCCAHYGEGSGPVWLDIDSCNGTETSILHCLHDDWGSSNCTHQEDVGCECQDKQVLIEP